MERSFLFLILVVMALGFILLTHTPKETHSHHHRRLKLRSNFSSPSPKARTRDHAAPFDPIILDIEQRREDKEWEKAHYSFPHHDPAPGEEAQPEWDDFMDAEDYINDEDRFNVTSRIVSLFPSIDINPADGFLTAEELIQWNIRQEAAETLHRTKRDMELHDKNHDGFVSFKEYDPPSWMRDHNSSGGVDWTREEHFNAADIDGDGLLNLTEFNEWELHLPTQLDASLPPPTLIFSVLFTHLYSFLHPSDSTNPKLILSLCKEEIRLRDKDGDGKLNFQEFFGGLFDSIRDHDSSDQSDGSSESLAKKKFSEIDRDNDGFLSDEEMKSVIGIIHPSEHYYAKQQADRALEEADWDKDGRLSLKEMIDNPYAFYRAIFSDEDESDYDSHDELR